MTAQTQAQRSAKHRTRKAEKMARMEAALREIVAEADGNFVMDSGMQYAAIIAERGLGL